MVSALTGGGISPLRQELYTVTAAYMKKLKAQEDAEKQAMKAASVKRDKKDLEKKLLKRREKKLQHQLAKLGKSKSYITIEELENARKENEVTSEGEEDEEWEHEDKEGPELSQSSKKKAGREDKEGAASPSPEAEGKKKTKKKKYKTEGGSPNGKKEARDKTQRPTIKQKMSAA